MVKLLSFASRILQVICHSRFSIIIYPPESVSRNVTALRNGSPILQDAASHDLSFPGEA